MDVLNVLGGKQRGVGLLEVLIAVVVLAVALLALGSFQGTLMQDSGYAKARSVGANLAQQKLDDLRSYKCLQDSATVGDPCDIDADDTIALFTGIVTDDGGAKDINGAVILQAGTNTVSNVNYTLNWAVADYYYCTDDAAPTTANACGAPLPNFKEVTVTVQWDVADAGGGEVQLASTINANDPSTVGELAEGLDEKDPLAVGYTPQSAPDVIAVPITIAGDIAKETSKPLPDIDNQGTNTIVSFDVVTYDTTTTDPANQTVEREQFLTINCECKYTGTGSGWTATTHEWDDTAQELDTNLGEFIGGKVIGEVANIQQHALCDDCCRDHHDTNQVDANGNAYPVYDAFRPSSDYDATTGNHNHYKEIGSGLSLQTNLTNGVYLEACRFKRANGLLYLMNDWHLTDKIVLPRVFLSTTANQADYLDWVEDVVKYEIGSIGTQPDPDSLLTNSRDLTLFPGDAVQAMSRSILIDPMSAVHKTAIINALNAGEDWLIDVPFYEVNTTLIDHWSSQLLTGTLGAMVTSEDVDTIADPLNNYYGSYSRGRIEVNGSAANLDQSSIIATSTLSNNGLTSTIAVDFDDELNEDSDDITVTVGDPNTLIAISGSFDAPTLNGSQKQTLLNMDLNAGTVSVCTGRTDFVEKVGSSYDFCFEVAPNWTGTITPTVNSYDFCTGSNASNRSYSNITAGQTGQDFCVVSAGATCPSPACNVSP